MSAEQVLQFQLHACAARAAELSTPEQWRTWALAPWLPSEMPDCKLARVPALQRRRVERSGRLALEVAFELLDTLAPFQLEQLALVFCSRHGDVARSAAIMKELAHTQPVSPTQFGLSVHNAVAAQFSIAAGLTNTYSVVAAGAASAEAAMVEAGALLVEHPLVMLVHYDEPLPTDFRDFEDEPMGPHAWGLLLGRPAESDHPDLPGISLAWRTAETESAAPTPILPASLAALQFLYTDARLRCHTVDGTTWRWTRP